MLTQEMSGLFEVREYDPKGLKKGNDRKLIAEGDNIGFTAIFTRENVPSMFSEETLRYYASKGEQERAAAENRAAQNDRVAVKFKIGSNCAWYDEHGMPCQKISNAELGESRWNVKIDFSFRARDEKNPLRASGNWCNAIMVQKIYENPFEGAAFTTLPKASEPAVKEESGDLPF